MTKIISVAMQKGGVGKTTQLFNIMEWLSLKSKVLGLDLDYHSSLSEVYNFFDPKETSLGIFTDEPVKVHTIHENLDFIPASPELEDIPLRLRALGVQNVFFLLEDWFYDNQELISKYDYIFIDTHPDTLAVTQNAIATSHYQLAFVEPSEFGYNAIDKTIGSLNKLKNDTFDRRTKQSLVTTELIFVANKIRYNENLSRGLIEALEEREDVNLVSIIENKTLFGESITGERVPIFKQLEDPKVLSRKGNKEFKQRLEDSYEKILAAIDQ